MHSENQRPQVRSSSLTYFLLKGIKNEEVVKQDGSLDIQTLFGYVKPQVEVVARNRYNNEQTPQLIGAGK